MTTLTRERINEIAESYPKGRSSKHESYIELIELCELALLGLEKQDNRESYKQYLKMTWPTEEEIKAKYEHSSGYFGFLGACRGLKQRMGGGE